MGGNFCQHSRAKNSLSEFNFLSYRGIYILTTRPTLSLDLKRKNMKIGLPQSPSPLKLKPHTTINLTQTFCSFSATIRTNIPALHSIYPILFLIWSYLYIQTVYNSVSRQRILYYLLFFSFFFFFFYTFYMNKYSTVKSFALKMLIFYVDLLAHVEPFCIYKQGKKETISHR